MSTKLKTWDADVLPGNSSISSSDSSSEDSSIYSSSSSTKGTRSLIDSFRSICEVQHHLTTKSVLFLCVRVYQIIQVLNSDVTGPFLRSSRYHIPRHILIGVQLQIWYTNLSTVHFQLQVYMLHTSDHFPNISSFLN